MKRKVVLMFIVVCLLLVTALPMFTACEKRSEKLYILSWEEYLDLDLIDDFEAYYTKVTGKTVEVEYQTCATNEIMYSKIASKKSDYDVICPSDYMVEKMYNENLLLKLTADLGDDKNGDAIVDYRGNVSSYLTGSTFDSVNHEYACAYTWGTLGIVYNRDVVSTASITSQGWGALWNNSYNQKIEMKDSVRDSYAAASLYTYKNPNSSAYDASMSYATAVNNTSATAMAKVKETLINQKDLVYAYETDNGKTDVVYGTTDLLLQWSGDAVYTLSEDLQIEECGLTEMKNLAYMVPEEGSNVWCDYWVVPKYAANTEAANLWINYMCTDKAALANMDYIGYTSAIATAATLDYATCDVALNAEDSDRYYLNQDLSYFFGDIDGANNVACIDIVQYPTQSIVDRCAVMLDFGENTQAITNMWTQVKNASGDYTTTDDEGESNLLWLWIILGIIAAAVVAYVVLYFVAYKKGKIYGPTWDKIMLPLMYVFDKNIVKKAKK